MNRLVCFTTIIGAMIVFASCKSPPPPQSGVDPNIAAVSTAGLRLGMTPTEVLDVSARRLYKEDEKNQDRLADLAQTKKERATIRLNRVRSLAAHESHAFYSNAITLTLEFDQNRLVRLEERHTGLGDADLRKAMRDVSAQFPFVLNRTDTGSNARWEYHGKNSGAYVRIDFRIVSNPGAKTAPMSSYTIIVADPGWATQPP
jgi:hypothetical protein